MCPELRQRYCVIVLDVMTNQGGDTMIMRDVFERFAKKTPVSVMVRATVENVLAADRLDAIFE